VTAVVVAEAPAPGCLPGLSDLLDAEGRIRLQRALIRRAARWAAAAARGRAILVLAGEAGSARLAGGPRDGGAGDPFGLAGDPDGALWTAVVSGPSENLSALVQNAVQASGPLVVAGAAWPRLGPWHASGAWADLDAGIGAVFGPALDGGAYLVALAAPERELLGLPARPAGLMRSVEAARAHGHEVGLLRHERGLVTGDDAAAFLADPLLDPELRAALGG
jgi:hypothetical protein